MRKTIGRVLGIVMGCMMVACNGSSAVDYPDEFTTDTLLSYTPVKNQGQSSLCWVYATLATIETEHIMRGDSVHLSTDYIARCFLEEQAEEYFLSGGKTTLNLRGTAPMLITLIRKYGCFPHDTYYSNPPLDYNALTEEVKAKADEALKQGLTVERFMKSLHKRLNEVIGNVPPSAFMYGSRYTPLEFAHSVCGQNEYIAYTSTTGADYNTTVDLQLKDNKYGEKFTNIPLDSMTSIIRQSLLHGHPVLWEGATKKKEFSFNNGVARLDSIAVGITAEQRQKDLDNGSTTDNHCLTLIGTAHNKRGERYYIAKNSWGESNPYNGLMYLSEDFIRLRTLFIITPR